MKELRVDVDHHTLRIAFAFDLMRKAILLVGGDKHNKPRKPFYRQVIAKADILSAEHPVTLPQPKNLVEESDMAKSFKELVARTGNAKTRQIGERRTRELVAEMIMSEIREALGRTPSQVAREAGMKQPSLAKLEAQSEILISTLRKVMKAMGGELEVAVRFPQGRVWLKQFELAPRFRIARSAAPTTSVREKRRPAKVT